jgi:flagellar motor switch protein FliG
MALAQASRGRVRSGRRKAAMLLVALGPELAAEVFRALDEDEIADLSAEVAEIGEVSVKDRQAVIEEFYTLAEERRLAAAGGVPYARTALVESFGAERAAAILDQVQRGETRSAQFRELGELDPLVIRDLLRDEHPQTTAVVLAHLHPGHAAKVISALPDEARGEVLVRLAELSQVQTDMVSEIQSTLRSRITQRPRIEPQIDGPRQVAQILNSSSKEVEEAALRQIERSNPSLAANIQHQMFLFEDLLLLEGKSIQKVLRGVDARTLAVAMKASTEEMREKIFSNMSKRAAGVLQGELEILGALPLADVEKAQREVIDIVRNLEREGEIVVPRGGDEQMA